MTSPPDCEAVAVQPFRIFEQIVPREQLQAFESGHQGIFSPWVVVWLMVFQRLHQNASLSRAVAELRLGAVAESLPDCKRVREDTISANTGGYSQARSDLPGTRPCWWPMPFSRRSRPTRRPPGRAAAGFSWTGRPCRRRTPRNWWITSRPRRTSMVVRTGRSSIS